jgi:hypothetical protein
MKFRNIDAARHELMRQQGALEVLGEFLRDEASERDKGKHAYGCAVIAEMSAAALQAVIDDLSLLDDRRRAPAAGKVSAA